MNSPVIFQKIENHHYLFQVSLHNPKILLEKIISVDLIKVIYDLNPDLYEKVTLEKIDDENSTILTVIKPLFKDLGLPQRYTFIDVVRSTEEDNIIFKIKSKQDNPPEVTSFMEQVPIKIGIITCQKIDVHTFNVTFDIYLESSLLIPTFMEKIIETIWKKILKRFQSFLSQL